MPTSFPRGSVEEDSVALADIVNPIDLAASVDGKLDELVELSAANEPELTRTASDLDASLSTTTEVDKKQPGRIKEKAQRPQILRKKPWFDVEHVRDALRFRSRIDKVEDFSDALVSLGSAGFPVVKIDLGRKFVDGTGWGWRFAGADFRMGDGGQLVEYYATFDEVMDANDSECHALYEKWRNEPPISDPAVQEQLAEDMERSRAIYRAAWTKALARVGLDERGARAALAHVRLALGR